VRDEETEALEWRQRARALQVCVFVCVCACVKREKDAARKSPRVARVRERERV